LSAWASLRSVGVLQMRDSEQWTLEYLHHASRAAPLLLSHPARPFTLPHSSGPNGPGERDPGPASGRHNTRECKHPLFGVSGAVLDRPDAVFRSFLCASRAC
jgi:hypothetical protein